MGPVLAMSLVLNIFWRLL